LVPAERIREKKRLLTPSNAGHLRRMGLERSGPKMRASTNASIHCCAGEYELSVHPDYI
jgi:hypothetical protein